MTESGRGGVTTLLEEALDPTGGKDRVAHLVLKRDWPLALCGANVSSVTSRARSVL